MDVKKYVLEYRRLSSVCHDVDLLSRLRDEQYKEDMIIKTDIRL